MNPEIIATATQVANYFKENTVEAILNSIGLLITFFCLLLVVVIVSDMLNKFLK